MPSLQLPNGVCLEYDVAGRRGPPLVLLPGLGNRRFVWAEVPLALSDRYQVYSCDLRGYAGAASDGPFTIADLAEDVALLLRGLRIEGAVVVGHSQGGFVSLELALSNPDLVRALVLTASASCTDEYGRTLLRHWRALAERGERRLLFDELFLWGFSPHFCNERTREMQILKSLIGKAPFDLGVFIRHALACETHETRDRLPALRVPTLLLGGDGDIVMTLRHNRLLKQLMPHSELVTVPNAGHHLVGEAPEPVLTALTSFLERVAPASAARGES
jgi:3-oxoadipate enol-lactonase